MKRKLIALFLAALILLPAAVGCADNSKTKETADTTAETTSTETAAETAEPYPQVDYDGYTFTMIVRGQSYGFWESNEMWSDTANGEALNDSVYQRILDLEEMYNIKVSQFKPTATVSAEVTKSVQAGEDAYQMILGAPSDASALATKNTLLDLRSISSLNLDRDWWDAQANSGLSIAKKLYFTTGDISYNLYRATEAILFNKSMIDEYHLDNPYELVNNGTWTLAKMLEMSQGISQDVNGDGVYDQNDKYGMITYTNVVTSGIFASGIHYNTKDENDLPELTFFSDKTTSVVADYINFMTDSKLCFDWANYYNLASDPNTMVGLVIFQENRGLFDYNGIHAVPNLRNMFSDFGIIPIPKYDESQDTYYACPNNVACPFISVPKTVADTSRAGTIIDAFARKGKELVRVAFYDITLKDKASRDEESKAMLDLIFSHLVYDVAFFFNFGDIGNLANTMMSSKKTDLASVYAKYEKKINADMEKFIDKVAEG